MYIHTYILGYYTEYITYIPRLDSVNFFGMVQKCIRTLLYISFMYKYIHTCMYIRTKYSTSRGTYIQVRMIHPFPLSPRHFLSRFFSGREGGGWWALVIGAGGKEKVGKPNFRQGMLFIYDSTYVTRVRPGGGRKAFFLIFLLLLLYVERYRYICIYIQSILGLMAASVLAAPAMVGKT